MSWEDQEKLFNEGLERVAKGAIPLHMEVNDTYEAAAVRLDAFELLKISNEIIVYESCGLFRRERHRLTGYGAYHHIVEMADILASDTLNAVKHEISKKRLSKKQLNGFKVREIGRDYAYKCDNPDIFNHNLDILAEKVGSYENIPKIIIPRIEEAGSLGSIVGKLMWYEPKLFKEVYGIVRGDAKKEWNKKRNKYDWDKNAVVVAAIFYRCTP